MASTHGGGGGACLQAAAPTAPKIEIKKTQIVDMMLSGLLRDLPFSQTQTMKLADD